MGLAQPAVFLHLRDTRAGQGFERKTRHQQKQRPVSLLGSGEVCQGQPLPSQPREARKKP